MRPVFAFLLTLAVVVGFWLLIDRGERPGDPARRPIPEGPGRETERDLSGLERPDGKEALEFVANSKPDETAPLEGAEEESRFGALVLVAHSEHGEQILDLGMRVVPAAGRFENRGEDGCLLHDVPPGDYVIDVWSPGYVPTSIGSVAIAPGTKTTRSIVLRKGLRVAGRVIDERTHAGVPNVLIRLGDFARTRSDGTGYFRVPGDLPPEALTTVSTSHPDYDDVTQIRPAVSAPESMTIALTRGDNDVHGVIRDPLGRLAEASIEVELALDTGTRRDVRRRMTVTGPRFHVRHVNPGTYWLTVRFPGLAVPERRTSFTAGHRQRIDVEIDIPEGAPIDGLVTQDMGRPVPVRVDLLDAEGIPVISGQSDAEGRFRFENVPAGSYRFKVWFGNPFVTTQPIELDGKGETRVEIKALSHRWVAR